MSITDSNTLNRRAFFASSSAAALTLGAAASARVAPDANSEYAYEVERTNDEWQSMLSDQEYVIMREGYTEAPKSSPLWKETRDGTYRCKGCELHVYSANTKVILDKGWVFFFHAEPDSVLMNVDGVPPEYGAMSGSEELLTEVHCRRCGSHLGHFLIIENKMTHCINGTSLVFDPSTS